MTKHKRSYNKHCENKKSNRFQTDSVVSGVLTHFVVVVRSRRVVTNKAAGTHYYNDYYNDSSNLKTRILQNNRKFEQPRR